ncbi:HAMP domain-containing sensor histidine kinase [Stenotrophomonas sp. MMGLT7]|uniref:sensor histidine kinase n=1 Tax=Stenotrophomonas sp. MMGLT7 TaxID=2901227 RepID=UPI001E4E3241|nr:HAMP domain-containing sensor histidine kinase [Stenotrophomonas sp. MMGLT7]MCD7098214.1 HAMP domain-containing histidine kinase [Stenotrophomonas sp. MMGLT7]
MPHGLPRKVRIAFIVQAALASLALLVAAYLVWMIVRHSLVRAALQEEAAHYWQLYEASPAQPPPNTVYVRGYIVVAGHSSLVLPASLRQLPPGFHQIGDGNVVLVDRQALGTLYLMFLRPQVERLFLWFGAVPIVFILLAIAMLSWLGYRVSKRLVSPVAWLARRVSHWDPRHPEADELAPERLPADVQGETRLLASSLHALAQRVTEHVTRERNFTRDASHELRTPLTVIRVASDMALDDNQLSPRTTRSLQRIQRAGRDMEAIIDAFLILAREAEVAPQSELFDVGEVVQYEADNARELLGDRPVRLHADIDAPVVLDAPPRVLHVVIGNLLRNACNYTDEGVIRIVVAPGKVSVSDTGIGMSSTALRQAFDPFYRADPNRPQGTGLGLSIVRRLCERFGWRIELRSVQGAGTTATVYFA